jgi:hypothetical protein
VTAQLECLLDDVVVGKQEMVGAIDAVCDVALRIIGKLKNGSPAGGRPLSGSGFGGAAGDRPPTSPMKRYAEIIARQKRIRPPPGYGSSGAICRAFLEQHAEMSSETPVGPWQGQFTKLRLPNLYNLHSDPFERGPTSIYYGDWMAHRAFVQVPMQGFAAKWLESVKEFPPRQKPASFNLDEVMRKMSEQGGKN